MIRGIYIAASGMLAESLRADVTANNLANVNTPGFRSDLEQSASVAVQGYGYDSRHLAHSQGNGVSLAPDALMVVVLIWFLLIWGFAVGSSGPVAGRCSLVVRRSCPVAGGLLPRGLTLRLPPGDEVLH